ncbi:MAG: Preprotein translocase subunit Sss1 [Candidatus Methanohalarchaeum thermophilum]|uniref:Protein translocase subunit SecE n=1 Tax=Methanohalarchaeum thermophilum TaxID=1903181 RepID=A0A1Q6DTA9_METT1|nr:MAG: Preprotein translocase subunit Sss1 [Candidatus Methanohalarchaeum thermophilum]
MSSRGKDLGDKIRDKLTEYFRVLKLAKKPGKEEFSQITKISVIGILLVGSIGFLVYLSMNDIPNAIADMDKAEMRAQFLNTIDPDKAQQTLEIQINNTNPEVSTGNITVSFQPINCELKDGETNVKTPPIPPDGSYLVSVDVINITDRSNLIAKVWGENLKRHESEGTALEITAQDTSPF